MALSSCTTMPDPPSISADPGSFSSLADQRAAQALKRRKIQGGLSLGVYSRGDILFARGYGFADHAQGQDITDETPMPVGSVSKTFTAVGVMQLVEDGIVGLEDPLSLHLPALSLPDGAEDRITAGMEDSLVYPGELETEIPLGYGMGEPSIPPRIPDMAVGSLAV